MAGDEGEFSQVAIVYREKELMYSTAPPSIGYFTWMIAWFDKWPLAPPRDDRMNEVKQ